MRRSAYFARRLLLLIPTFIGITLVCWALTSFLPGGPVDRLVAEARGIGAGGAGPSTDARQITEAYRAELLRAFRLDRPFFERYYHWLVTDHLGMAVRSYKYRDRTVWELVSSRLPVSLIFGITGFLLSYLVCIPLGIAKALRNGKRFDLVSSVIVFVGYAIPPFALGMVLKMGLSGTVEGLIDFFPIAGFESDGFASLSLWGKVGDRFRHMFLPVLCYVAGNFAFLTLLMKNSLLDQISSDYVRTVIAKGARFRYAVWRHALRNALIPIATGFGRILTLMFAGSVIIERVFEIPGMGLLGFEAIISRDYAVFMGVLSMTSILTLLGNILSDFCYVLIDPRIRFDA